MKITAVHVQDFKRVRSVSIKPDADRTVVLIGGKNGAGKSSVLDAMTAAFGGSRAKPADAVRHGADAAGILVELDGGKLTVHRVIRPDGETTLEVRDQDGPVRSPQAVLDRIVGARFLDPLAFVHLPPLEQRATLLRLVDGDGKIAAIEEKRQKVFDHRTEIGRDIKKAEGEIARLPPAEVGKAIDVASLAAERAQLADAQRASDGLGLARTDAARARDAAQIELDRALTHARDLERQLLEVRRVIAAQEKFVAERTAALAAAAAKVEKAAAEWVALQPRREEIDAKLAQADEHNRAVFAAEAANARRAAAEKTVASLASQRLEQTQFIEKMEARKLALLAAARLPVDNLGVDEHGVTLDGVPFAQASGAERLRVALALAIAGSPGLRDIWIKDGALLDEESLALVATQAEQLGYRVWIERVGSSDPGAIVIQDGTVLE